MASVWRLSSRAQDANGWYKAYEYDALGRVTREYSNVGDNRFGYDAAGRRTRQTWSDGFYVTYDYDTLGEMTAIRENGTGGTLASFGYDDLGERTSLLRGNGTVTRWGYDAVSRLQSLTQDLVGTASDLSVTYGYNAASQIRTRTGSNAAYAWGGAVNVDRAYSTNNLNQYTSAGSTNFGYDGRGNLTTSGSTTFGYDSRNELSRNASGQLLYHNPVGELGQLPGPLNLDWAAGQLATETDGSGAIQRRYVYGPGADEVLVWYEGAGTSTRRWLHADERGSIVAVSDGSGNKLAINSYDDYGIPGPSNLGRFQYTGQYWLAEAGVYDFKARAYSPTLGRFLQTDPIGYADGMGWYTYAHSDPVNGTDPSGLDGRCGAGYYAVPRSDGASAAANIYPASDVVATSNYRCELDPSYNPGGSLPDNYSYNPAGSNGSSVSATIPPAMQPQRISQPARTPNRLDCFQMALQNNFASLAIDGGGALLAAVAPEAKLAQIAVSSTGIVAAAFAGDKPALGIGITGYHLTALDGQLLSRVGNQAIRGLGTFFGILAIGRDLKNIRNETQACRAKGGQ